MVLLSRKEMDRLANLWDIHRFDCIRPNGDMKIEMLSGGGIGTRIVATCSCSKELDATDYSSW